MIDMHDSAAGMLPVLVVLLSGGLLGPAWAQSVAAPPEPVAGPGSSALIERAHAEAPDPLLLLRLAELSVKAGQCEDGLGYYERFFELCAKCDALGLGAKRFEETVERCLVTIDRESAVRSLVNVPRSKEPVPSPADATVREVVDLLEEAHFVHRARAHRARLTLAEAGQRPSVRLLNELREAAFGILSEKNASREQVENFLRRLKTANLTRHDELQRALEAATDVVALNGVRRLAMFALVSGSMGGREAKSTVATCLPNDELEWGHITVGSNPWSDVYVNGENLGSTPIARAEALAGCVTVRLVNPVTGASVLKNVTVRSNKVAVLLVDLKSGRATLRYE